MLATATLIAFLFFFTDTATTEIYTLSLHDALPIYSRPMAAERASLDRLAEECPGHMDRSLLLHSVKREPRLVFTRLLDRKSTRLNSSHSQISYAVFCLKKKNNKHKNSTTTTRQHNS